MNPKMNAVQLKQNMNPKMNAVQLKQNMNPKMNAVQLKQNMKVKANKMNYTCSVCSFKWNGYSDTFENVIIHEKTHVNRGSD